ncbi:hypothetical protein GCM10027449_21490 [Sinomonas notoginsengisoli]|uniref:hypothetical protein n=1 Tax=Sinomonas notoginsengisoli TaxID=1457311 RepID=UPI001F1C22B4|nr:hypothetical protein [Sinomonas notoginsengisoli]
MLSTRWAALVAAGTLALSGCAGPAGSGGAGLQAPASAAPAARADATGAAAQPAEPSPAATMVCEPEIRERIAQILALPAQPQPESTWSQGLFSCIYRLPTGTLLLSVQESATPAAARAHFDALKQRIGTTADIDGLANLGFPAYQSATGTVVFLKDSFTLTADATGLAEPVGPHGITRTALAYQVATDVLACWSEG